MGRFRYSLVVGVVMLPLLSACVGGGNDSDLTDFINETKRRPKGEIEPIPSFRPYQPFAYEAQRLRDPFERPVSELQNLVLGSRESVKPDPNRPREVLEEFDFAELSMKGTFRDRANVLWALINDGQGNIHPVREGNYLGKHHGRIVTTATTQVNIIEIVPDGVDGWLQRPRSLKLDDKE
jgi:type IV pilus assembly protein PilP